MKELLLCAVGCYGSGEGAGEAEWAALGLGDTGAAETTRTGIQVPS